jgi:hypothetical protein
MTYNAFITRITNVRKHPDPKVERLQIGECFGQQIVVGLDTKEGDLGIYFPTDGRLSMEFMEANNLIGKKDPITGERTGGYFDERGKVRTQKFRGTPSDGYFCSLGYLSYTGVDISSLQEGTPITVVNDHKICEKYITEQTRSARTKNAKPREKTKYPCFHEHIDTEQLAYNIDTLKEGTVLILTEKVHGTSQRTSNTFELKYPKWGMWINGIFKKEVIHPIKDYNYVCGTRRVILKNLDQPSGFYGENETFRKKAHEMFLGKLYKGETAYYEVVGWANENVLIMPEADNRKLNDKEFLKRYGPKTIFHYGCPKDTFDVFIYRMTLTNEDGHEVDYDWNTTKQRCNEMAIKHVPELTKMIYDGQRMELIAQCERFFNGCSNLTPAHLMEGVVVRVDGSRWYALKHKSFQFKVLEGIIKDTAVVDMEEAQDV